MTVTASKSSRALQRIFQRHCRKPGPAPMAVMDLLLAAPDVPGVLEAAARFRASASPAQARRVAGLTRLIRAHRAGCERIAGMLRAGVDDGVARPGIAQNLAFSRQLFDWSVQQDPSASVALYSLGSPRLLARATREVVAWLRGQKLLGKRRRTLEIGCGIGRMQAATAGAVGEAHGVDLSVKMIAAARERCAGLPNVQLHHVEGRDLSLFPDQRFELVYAVDSFPYLVQSGLALAKTHFREAFRVLAPGGALVIFNFSYRGDDARDVRDARRLAAAAGFEVVGCGERPFKHWTGAVFHFRKSG